jgi:hypothetical protein
MGTASEAVVVVVEHIEAGSGLLVKRAESNGFSIRISESYAFLNEG